MSCGSGEILNDSVRCGFRPNVRQIRPTIVWLIPARLAIDRVLQWVSPGGVVSSVVTITASTSSSVMCAARRPGFIVDAFQSLGDEPLAPLADGRIGRMVPSRHRAVQRAVRARQDETRTERHRSIDARPLREPDQRVPLVIRQDQEFLGASSLWHAPLDHNACSISS